MQVDISAVRTPDVGRSDLTPSEDTRATLDKPAEAPVVRQVEFSKKDDNPKQSGAEPVVPQKTAAGTGVLVMFTIVLLVISALFFALQQDKWHVWQDEITNWWADFSMVQAISNAPSLGPRPVVKGSYADFDNQGVAVYNLDLS